jgi:signal transduction histidine kinase
MTRSLPRLDRMTPTHQELDPLAALRHELCSPLAAVTALIETLTDDGDLSVECRREIARLAYWQARHMAAVLHGTAAGRRALIEVVLAARVAAGVPEARLRTQVTAEAAGIAVDARPVQQVLTNLLVNSLRHGAAGADINLEARRDGGMLVLTVHNRLPARYRRRPAGHGLRIVTDLVTAAGGSFELRCLLGAARAEAELPVSA